MLTLFIMKALLTIAATLVFFALTFIILYTLDKRGGVGWKEQMSVLRSCPRSLSLYLSARLAGVLAAVGMIVCLVFLL